MTKDTFFNDFCKPQIDYRDYPLFIRARSLDPFGAWTGSC